MGPGTGGWPRRMRIGVLAAALWVGPGTAHAGPRAERELTRLAQALAEPAGESSAGAIAVLAALGTPESAALLQAHLREGQPDAVTDRVLAALDAHPSRAALGLLVELSHHRRSAVRVAAHTALAKLSLPEVTALLSEGLRDGQAEVRGNAARLLGQRGDRAAVEVLFLAFERGVPEAAEALGRLAPAETLPRFGAYLERRALHVMLGGYTRFMERADIAEASKLQVIATLEQVSGPLVKQWLRAQLAARTTPAEQRVRFAVAASLARVVERPEPADTAPGPRGKPEGTPVPTAKPGAP
jgi:hypothetical protein